MKKYRSHTAFQRALSALLCLSMLLSLVNGIGLSGLQSVTKNVKAEEGTTEAADKNEYANETLEHMWDSNGDGDPDTEFLNAARPYYACRNGSFGGVQYRTIFHVFAFEGDTICIGSSVFDSTLDINHTAGKYNSETSGEKGSTDIVMTDLNGVAHAIDIRNSDEDGALNQTGYIGNWQTEWAAINCLEKKDGKFSGTYNDGTKNYTYTPYTYTVTETGIYTFEFHSYDKSNSLSDLNGFRMRNEPFQNYKSNYGGEIAAINLTVFNESGEEQHGRTFADFLSMQMHPDGKGVVDSYYILTTDSYIYKMQFNNASPYTYNFFSNNKGLYDPATGDIIYTSVKDISNTNDYARMGAAYKYPGTKDTDMLKSYYIFLEYPDDQLEGEMYEKPVPPDPATNLRFVSQITDDKGNKVTGAYEGEGGYFAFDVEEATTATLRLEFKVKDEDGNQKYAPVEISGAVTPHTTNYFYWNGKDGNGKTIPIGTYEIKDLAFTVTTKAGEIHFPIIDMEYAKDGITFTRMSHIYDKNGEQLDTKDNIYGLTKNLIYYDDTAIYYGEPAASTGFSEADVDKFKEATSYASDPFGGNYYSYTNMNLSGGGEFAVRNGDSTKTYVVNNKIRVGDHSHTTNVVNYFDNEGKLLTSTTQQDMIDYLDSYKYPVGKSTGGNTTTDYAIANFWTFIPSQPASASGDIPTIVIKDPPANYFNLTGRVFFDADKNAKFDDMTDSGDYGLSGVTLNLYKKTSDPSFNAGKTYVSYDASSNTVKILDSSTFGGATERYELVDTGKTTGDGMYKFTGLEYDPTGGTDYLYQVVKPLNDYKLTTGAQNAAALTSSSMHYGYYADKSYNKSYFGTEVQHIIVGGTGADHVDPTKYGYNTSLAKPEGNTTVCAVDVGYNYEVMKQSLELKKSWDTGTEDHPTAVAYEISYHLENSTADNLYKYRVISAIDAWSYEDEYLPTVLDGKDVNNYYVSAEYYISTDGKTIYKHEFDYNSSAGKYESFVGEVYKVSIEDLQNKIKETTKTDVKVENFSNIPDLSVLKSLTWTEVTEGEPYRAVLDRNVGSDKSTITVTNAKQHGTIEIFKYYDDPLEKNALQGATFRIYELKDGVDLTEIKKLASSGNTEDLKTLQGYQVGSGTTRANGRIAFPGLDPTKSYVVREMYPPAGYRILNEFYEVRGKDAILPDKAAENYIYKFDENNYVKVDVGNAPADSNFYILKRIEGRAWQDNDSFTFSIKNAFDRAKATESGLSSADGIAIDINERSIAEFREDTAVLTAAETFAANFKGTGASKITINDKDNGYYSYEAADQHEEGKTNTYTYPDRKMSDKLLTDGKGAGEGDPTFCGVKFPFAGTYTFTITENDIEGDTKETLTKSEREYTVTITVKRVRKEGSEGDTETTTENSHLEAEVSSITYKDGTEGVSQIFAGSSPLFTNTYAPAPAKQDTTYNIVKEFTGRTGNAWLDDDKFTIRVSGVDDDTQNAITSGSLAIDGFTTDELVSSGTGTTKEWVHEFNSTNKDTSWKFKSFTFKNIMFPVQYVLNGKDPTDPKNVWQSTEDNPTPSQDQIGEGDGKYSPQTVPVTYWLKIAEDIPADVKGIDYDDQVYYLQIILRNAEEKVSTGTAGKEEEDGIIDEIDMKLYHVDRSVIKVEDITGNPVATCETDAVVYDSDKEWQEANDIDNDKISEYTWFYVKNDNTLVPVSEGERPTDDKVPKAGTYKLLVIRRETHGGDEDGHTMTFSNVYHTSYSWAPQVKKTLKGAGREWLDTDKFTFKIKCTDTDKPGVTMPTNDTIEINKGTIGYTKTFSAIEFSIPGDYHFTITETDNYGHTLATYNVTVTVADNNDGTLTPTIKGSDSSVISEDYFEFVNTYESTSFDLSISKAVIGRDWNDGEKFTFKILPDDVTKAAIDGGIITMPKAVGELSDGSYTVTIDKGNYHDDEKLAIKDLDQITINNTGSITEETQYKFTISEVTDGLDLEEMYCREPSIDVNVTVDPKILEGTTYQNKFNLVITYAHRVSGTTGSTEATDNVVIPFENVALGKLTVANKVVTSAAEDTTEFTFVVVFTYADDKDHNIKASSTELVPEKSSDDNKWTYTFTLRDGESVEFSNIPPNTEYTIKETVSEKYMLLRVRDHSTDDGDTVALTGTSVSGKITPPPVSSGEENHQYRLFVNGLIKDLPSSGGIGTWRYIFLGTVLTVVALLLFAVLYSDRRTRKGSND